MHRFQVWAPHVEKMAINVDGATFPMRGPDSHGWWELEVDEVRPGAEYAYYIDEDPTPYPDPRSQWQPKGVHGVSRVYDQTSFRWGDASFCAPALASGILYELHVGTFTPEGTLDAAICKLDYLTALGVTHVELMPLAAFAGERGWGYDGVSLFAVHSNYGGPEALKRFVNAAHCKGLAVLLDVVYNHFGPVGNYSGKFGPYVTELHRTPWGGAVNLEEAGADQVRRFFCDNALMWLRDFHADGLRLDAVHAFVDRSAIHFLEQLTREVDALASTISRSMVLIAESDLNDPRIVTPRESGGFGLDAQWSDDFHHALFAVLAREERAGYYRDFGEIGQLSKALVSTFVYDGVYSKHRDRVHGKWAGNLSQNKFVGFIQNHDQIGNRAFGDRLQEIVGWDRAKIAAAVVLTSPFIPLIFQGEEWAASSPFQYFADHDDPKVAKSVSEGRKREFRAFGWDPDMIPDPEDPATFERCKLKWDELGERKHREMHDWYKDLIRLRRATPSLNDGGAGRTRFQFDEEEKWFSMMRGDITLICNLGEEPRSVETPIGREILLSSRQDVEVRNGKADLLPDTIVIYG
jgi:maltooligosyltrehalose trehalohydrolase